MADGDVYASVVGVVQFDPRENAQQDGRTFRDVTVRGSGGINVQVSMFDNYPDLEIHRGDLVFAHGKYTSKSTQDGAGAPVTYHTISAYSMGVVAQEPRVDTRQGASAPAQTNNPVAPF